MDRHLGDGWRNVPLGEVLTLQRGFDITKQQQSNGPYWVVSSSGPSSTHSEYMVKGPGVIIGRKGTLGTVFYSADDYWPHDTTLWVKDFHGNEPRFVYYFLKTMNLAQYDVGASNPTLNRNHVHLLTVRWPVAAIQRKIAAILSAYDDLIENNSRRIKILEEMAQALYREWFVRFRSPGHEGVRMVETELGLVPEGWEARILRDVTSYINRGISPKYGDGSEQIVINQKCIRDGRLSLDLVRRHSSSVPELKVVRFGDGLINSTGIGTLGRVAQVYQELSNCTVDSHVSIVRPNEGVDLDYFGFVLLSLQPRFDSLGTGSTGQTELSRESIANTKFLYPPKDLQGKFGELVSPMRRATVQCTATNANLRRTRDLLLPRLISGEVDVDGLEIVGDAVGTKP